MSMATSLPDHLTRGSSRAPWRARRRVHEPFTSRRRPRHTRRVEYVCVTARSCESPHASAGNGSGARSSPPRASDIAGAGRVRSPPRQRRPRHQPGRVGSTCRARRSELAPVRLVDRRHPSRDRSRPGRHRAPPRLDARPLTPPPVDDQAAWRNQAVAALDPRHAGESVDVAVEAHRPLAGIARLQASVRSSARLAAARWSRPRRRRTR